MLAGRWWPWNRSPRFWAAWNGRVDGQKGIPPAQQSLHAPYEMELKQICEENVQRLAQSWQAQDARRHADYCNAKRESESLADRVKALEPALKDAEQNATNVRAECREHVHFASWLYAALMLAIAVGEFPLNMIVFQLFGEREMLTQLMAGAAGFVPAASRRFSWAILSQSALTGRALSVAPGFHVR